MKALKLVSKTLKSLLAGDDDRLHPSESYTRDPINPQFGRLSDHLNYAAYELSYFIWILSKALTQSHKV